jgi:hypothetical protein
MSTTGVTVKIGDVELAQHQDTLSFTVPSADKIKPTLAEKAGTKYDKTFYFGQVSSEDEAVEVCKFKEWTLVDFVNDALKSAARASAYQAESALYKPTDVSDDEIVERMVRDYIRLGIPEAAARAQVQSMLANK